MTEKELEKLFREKFEGRTYEFNPAAWAGAEKLIVEGERRKRRRAVFAWSAAASVALVAGLTSWNAMTSPEMAAPNQVAWPSEPVSADVQSMAVEDADETSTPTDLSSEEVETTSRADVSFNAVAAETNTQSTSTASQAGVTLSSPSNGVASSADVSHTIAMASTSNTVSSAYSRSRAEEEVASTFSEEVVVLNQTKFADVSYTIASVDDITESAAYMESQRDQSETVDNTAEEDGSPIIIRPKHNSQPISVGVDVGLNASSLTGGSNGWIPAFYGGAAVNYAFNSTWSLESGLIYSRRSSFGNSETSSTTTYGFGSTRIDMEVDAKWVDYFEMPLLARFRAGNHEFEAGAYAAYKAFGVSRVTRTISSPTASTETDTYWSQDDDDRNSTWDYGLRVGYAYIISDRWRITASGVVGMTDGFAFANSGFNQHLQLRVGGRYMLW